MEAKDSARRWQAIQVRHLEALRAIAKERSFHEAAFRLGYVQSAISSQLAQLEAVAGVRLIDRASGTARVELTAAGELLLRHTDEILARLEAAQADLDSLTARHANIVRVAGLDLLPPHWVAQSLTLVRDRCPLARIHMVESPRQRDGRTGHDDADLTILGVDVVAAERTTLLYRDPPVLLAPRMPDLPKTSSLITADALRRLQPIVPRSDQELCDHLEAIGVKPHPAIKPGTAATAEAMVSAGIGHAVAYQSQLSNSSATTTVVGLGHLLPSHALAVTTSEAAADRPAVRTVKEALRETCAVHVAEPPDSELPARAA